MTPTEVLYVLGSVFAKTWWLVAPPFLFFTFLELWLGYVRLLYLRNMQWVLLEVKVPKEITRTPKAMEQVFAAVNAIWPKVSFWEKWLKGKVADWVSFEIVGYSGGVYFFIRLPSAYRNLIEAALYAQYPGAEITEASDYVEILPSTMPNKVYDLFGTNYVLAREDAYPIRTYEYFEDMEEERRLDPIAAITEAMSKLKSGEMIWLQLLIQPVEDDWKKKAEETINQLIGAKPKSSPSIFSAAVDLIVDLIKAPFVPPDWAVGGEKKPEKKSEGPQNLVAFLTTHKRDVVKAMEDKISKIGFKTNFRFLYIDRRDSFTRVNVAAVVGALQQFNTKHLNAFKPDMATMTIGKHPFKQRREYLRKRDIFTAYKFRAFAGKSFILNTEELATLYHFPSIVVAAPKLQRLEAKKGEPPPNLPIED